MGHKRQATKHPAYPHMVHEAHGYLTRFRTDLEFHDVRCLNAHEHTEPFSWVLTDASTHICWPCEYLNDRDRGLRISGSSRYADMVTGAFGADSCRYYFWTGTTLVRHTCAYDLDAAMASYEEEQKRAAYAGMLADRGIA